MNTLNGVKTGDHRMEKNDMYIGKAGLKIYIIEYLG